MFLVLLDEATAESRAAVHESIKEHAAGRGWWHHFPNVWIVGGGSAIFWRDLLRNLIPPPGSVLVMKLPDQDPERLWAYSGPGSSTRTKWLNESYSHRPRKVET